MLILDKVLSIEIYDGGICNKTVHMKENKGGII